MVFICLLVSCTILFVFVETSWLKMGKTILLFKKLRFFFCYWAKFSITTHIMRTIRRYGFLEPRFEYVPCSFLPFFFSTACLMYSNNKFISYNIIDGASLCNALIVTLHNTISYNFSEIITRYSWFNIKYHSNWNNFLSFLELYHLILKIWIKSSLLTCTKLRMLDSLNWPVNLKQLFMFDKQQNKITDSKLKSLKRMLTGGEFWRV